MKSQIIIMLLLSSSAALASSLDTSVHSSLGVLRSELNRYYTDGKGFPSDPNEVLKRSANEALESHLVTVQEFADRSGVRYRRVGRLLEIEADEKTQTGKVAQRLRKLGLKRVVYDPAYLANFAVVGAYDNKASTLLTTSFAVATGEVDSVFYHESIHAFNALDPKRTPQDLKLLFKATGKKDLRDGAFAYSRYLSADELPAHIGELRFLLGDSEALTEIQGDSGQTQFQDKVSILADIVRTIDSITEQLSKRPLVLNSNKLTTKGFDVELDCSTCPAVSKEGFLKLIERLRTRNSAIKMSMEALENGEPKVLVEELEKALK